MRVVSSGTAPDSNPLVPSSALNASLSYRMSSGPVLIASAPPLTQGGSSNIQTGIGDYVAAGIGLDGQTTLSTSLTTLTPASAAVRQDVTTIAGSDKSITVESGSRTNGIPTPKNATGTGRPGTWPNTGVFPQAVNSSTSVDNSIPLNITYVGDCWDQWMSYWTLSTSVATLPTRATVVNSPVTSLETWLLTAGIDSPNTTTLTAYVMRTITDYQGTQLLSTRTTTFSTNYLTVVPLLEPTATITSTFTHVYEVQLSTSTFPTTTVPSPSCTLPPQVSQCQEQWDSYGSAVLSVSPPMEYPSCDICPASWDAWDSSRALYHAAYTMSPPFCAQASVGSAICRWVRSRYMYGFFGETSRGYQQTTYVADGGGLITTYLWPTSTSLAPSCTLGCETCAITGGNIQFIYWPPIATTRAGGATGNNMTLGSNYSTSITQDVFVTATGFGTTFTSPTVYISYDSLYASDSCSGVGKTYYNTIIPVKDPNELSSLWGRGIMGPAGD